MKSYGQQKPSGLYASDRDVFMFLIDGGSLLDAGPRGFDYVDARVDLETRAGKLLNIVS